MLTRLVAMKRRSDIGLDDFRRHWREVHGPLMAQVPGALEMWYASLDVMVRSLASDEAIEAMKHGREFLSTVTTYLVEEVRIAP